MFFFKYSELERTTEGQKQLARCNQMFMVIKE